MRAKEEATTSKKKKKNYFSFHKAGSLYSDSFVTSMDDLCSCSLSMNVELSLKNHKFSLEPFCKNLGIPSLGSCS